MDGGTPFLPQDIIANILKRLPVRSLSRFQCVCKLWKDLIKSSSFIEAHLHHSSNQNPLLLWPGCDNVNPLPLYLLDCHMRILLENSPVSGSVLMIGSCNGLLLFKCFPNGRSPPSLSLCNLAIREIRQLPRSNNKLKGDCFWLLGFGFSPILNDYKIVNFRISIIWKVIGVEVYSLALGSWKKVEFENLPDVGHAYSFEIITANGVMYCLGEDPDMIISFDLATEVFTLIPMPPLYSILTCRHTVFENKLAMLSLSSTYIIELWVMEEEYSGGLSREKWNWTKKYTIGPFAHLLRPDTIWRNEIVCHGVLKTEHEAENDEPTKILYLFNPTSVGYRTVTIGKRLHGIFNFSESLVPLSSNRIERP